MIWLAIGLTVVFVFFALFPSADIAVSRLFYDEGTCGSAALCGGFPRGADPAYEAVRQLLYGMPYGVLTVILMFNSAVFIWYQISLWRDLPVVTALVSCMLIGPLFIVNVVLKEHVLRSRPRDVTIFGGDLPFVPVGQVEGMCSGNCSFVSGEAAIAPIMMLSVLLFPKAWQKPAFFVLLPASLLMAGLRLVTGAHYVSDVVLGYGSTVLVFCILAQLIGRFRATKLAV